MVTRVTKKKESKIERNINYKYKRHQGRFENKYENKFCSSCFDATIIKSFVNDNKRKKYILNASFILKLKIFCLQIYSFYKCMCKP